jgi:hypothetical protein
MYAVRLCEQRRFVQQLYPMGQVQESVNMPNKTATVEQYADCSVCVHGHDLDPRASSMVVCTPQHKAHDPRHCCSGFRHITIIEIDERSNAKFGKPNIEITGDSPVHRVVE